MPRLIKNPTLSFSGLFLSIFLFLVLGPLSRAPAQSTSAGGFGAGGTAGGFGASTGTSSLGGTSFGTGMTASGTSTGVSGTSLAPSTIQTSPIQSATPGVTRTGAASSSTGVTSGIQPGNAFGSYYANPLAAGILGIRQGAFGTPLYTATATTTSSLAPAGTARVGGGFAGAPGAGTIVPTQSPTYTVMLDFDYSPSSPGQVEQGVKQVLANSGTLASSNIQVSMEGQVAVLRGAAANEHDRRLAENLLRLTPGVNGVRNEIKISASPKAKSTP
jgi:hypothetical protein